MYLEEYEMIKNKVTKKLTIKDFEMALNEIKKILDSTI